MLAKLESTSGSTDTPVTTRVRTLAVPTGIHIFELINLPAAQHFQIQGDTF